MRVDGNSRPRSCHSTPKCLDHKADVPKRFVKTGSIWLWCIVSFNRCNCSSLQSKPQIAPIDALLSQATP